MELKRLPVAVSSLPQGKVGIIPYYFVALQFNVLFCSLISIEYYSQCPLEYLKSPGLGTRSRKVKMGGGGGGGGGCGWGGIK